MNKINGWLNIYKPRGISSFFVLKKIKKKFKFSKIGHAGTLDPLAEGILPVAVGKTTKLISFINKHSKEYEFEIKWGEQTSTDDSEGEIIKRSKKIPEDKEIKQILKKTIGIFLQTPPKASAVKIDGERAYKLFRKKINFEVKKKFVNLLDSKLIGNSNKNISKISIRCGPGFYVRSYARDLGDKLDSSAHIFSLKRTKVGKFLINNSILLDDLLKIGEMTSAIKGFHSSISMLDDILAFEIDEEIIKDVSKGRNIEIKRIKDFKDFNFLKDNFYFLTNNNSLVSLGIIEGKYFKPRKVFL